MGGDDYHSGRARHAGGDMLTTIDLDPGGDLIGRQVTKLKDLEKGSAEVFKNPPAPTSDQLLRPLRICELKVSANDFAVWDVNAMGQLAKAATDSAHLGLWPAGDPAAELPPTLRSILPSRDGKIVPSALNPIVIGNLRKSDLSTIVPQASQ